MMQYRMKMEKGYRNSAFELSESSPRELVLRFDALELLGGVLTKVDIACRQVEAGQSSELDLSYVRDIEDGPGKSEVFNVFRRCFTDAAALLSSLTGSPCGTEYDDTEEDASGWYLRMRLPYGRNDVDVRRLLVSLHDWFVCAAASEWLLLSLPGSNAGQLLGIQADSHREEVSVFLSRSMKSVRIRPRWVY